ncbi:MAG: sugar-binding transcriptional regulator [Hyphomicrobiales bacterium]|jgi:DNA-binding transcriptional regulator LsrR (DeoR family)
MSAAESRVQDDVAQAAWLYYVGNLSQQEISDRLGVSRFKVVRMLADAREQGLVRISVEHRTSKTLALADQLASKFALEEVQVAPVPLSLEDEAYERNAVGILAANYLARVLSVDEPLTVGVGWGRTLSAMADNLSRIRKSDVRFVSIMGSVADATHTAPGDVCIRLAATTQGSAMLMPAPFIADSAEACQTLMQQRLVNKALQVARAADHALMSVGECGPGAILFESQIFTDEQKEELQAAGVVGDCCGVFFAEDGSVADTPLNACTPCVRPNEMSEMDTVILASGKRKTTATLAVLRAGFAKRLLIDETLASSLLMQ